MQVSSALTGAASTEGADYLSGNEPSETTEKGSGWSSMSVPSSAGGREWHAVAARPALWHSMENSQGHRSAVFLSATPASALNQF